MVHYLRIPRGRQFQRRSRAIPLNGIPAMAKLSRKPMHPGAILREDVLPALGLSVSATAERLGVSRQFLHRILAGQAPITAAMALRIGKFCGNGPELWLDMQQACDLWEA